MMRLKRSRCLLSLSCAFSRLVVCICTCYPFVFLSLPLPHDMMFSLSSSFFHDHVMSYYLSSHFFNLLYVFSVIMCSIFMYFFV